MKKVDLGRVCPLPSQTLSALFLVIQMHQTDSQRAALYGIPYHILVSSAHTVVAAVLLQANIYFNEGGNGEIVEQYRNCVSDDLSRAIECNTKNKLINISIPVST